MAGLVCFRVMAGLGPVPHLVVRAPPPFLPGPALPFVGGRAKPGHDTVLTPDTLATHDAMATTCRGSRYFNADGADTGHRPNCLGWRGHIRCKDANCKLCRLDRLPRRLLFVFRGMSRLHRMAIGCRRARWPFADPV